MRSPDCIQIKKINDFFYVIASFMNNFEPVRWRWSHCYIIVTQHQLILMIMKLMVAFFSNHNLLSFLFIFFPGSSFLTIHKGLHAEIIKHALGVKTQVMEDCIPEDKKKNCINSSRIFVSLWLTIILLSFYLASFLPILLFFNS